MMKYGMGAMQEYEKALSLDPENVTAHFGRGMGRLMAPEGFGRDYDGALEDFKFVCDKDPSADSYYYLGQAYAGKGQKDQAAEAYNKALSLKPDFKDAAKALAELK
jgi:tetratricopeptide (TPR) repeat protein